MEGKFGGGGGGEGRGGGGGKEWVIKISNDIYENLLVLLTKLNQDNELRIVLIEGKRTLVKMELDNSLESVEKFLLIMGLILGY